MPCNECIDCYNIGVWCSYNLFVKMNVLKLPSKDHDVFTSWPHLPTYGDASSSKGTRQGTFRRPDHQVVAICWTSSQKTVINCRKTEDICCDLRSSFIFTSSYVMMFGFNELYRISLFQRFKLYYDDRGFCDGEAIHRRKFPQIVVCTELLFTWKPGPILQIVWKYEKRLTQICSV